MKILVINWQDIKNPYGGGAEVHLHEIFKRIVNKGHEVFLLCSLYKNAKTEEVVDGIYTIRWGKRNLFNFVVPRAYYKLAKKFNFDIVVDDINKIPFYTPLFVKKPLIAIIHHLFGASIFIESKLPIAIYVNIAERLIPTIYRNTPITVVSESTKQELIQKGIKKNNLHIIYNGVDQTVYRLQQVPKNPTPLIGYLGRIKKYKSVDHLIRAFKIVVAKVPEARLLVMGDGDYLPRLQKLTTSLNLDSAITFTGAADEEIKISNLNKIWFTVNPSSKEGWGLTVIESNACGVPVIAANTPGLRDSVIDGKTGLLFNYGDIKQLAEKMILLIQQERLRQTLSQNGVTWAQNFTWDQSAKKMLNLLENTLHGGN